MPYGYVITTALFALCVGTALMAPHPRQSRPWRISFFLSYAVNEIPFTAAFVLVGITVLEAVDGNLVSFGGALGGALALLALAGLVVIVVRATRARPVLDAALAEELGVTPARRPHPRSFVRWLRIVVWPFPWWFRRDVARSTNIAYGPDGRHHRLDVYHPRRRAASGPILIHLHGGAFRIGRKSLETRPLLNRLTSRGWVCVSANYRLGHDVLFPEQLIDVKRVVAWAREHAAEYGADPGQIHLAGSSAGAHLAATAGLTANDPRFQPDFEDVDTSVVSVICLYGYYGRIATTGPASSPHDHVGSDPPPFAIIHGERDTLVIVEDARAFRRDLVEHSRAPVLYAELPGAHHDFDLFHSIRFEAVIDALEVFTYDVRNAMTSGNAAGSWNTKRWPPS